MNRIVLPAVAAFVIAVGAPPSSAAGVPTLTECHMAYTASSYDYTMRTCDFIATGRRGGIVISGSTAWGYVSCTLSGQSGANYGGTSSFRAQVGDLCHLHLYSSQYAYAYGHAYTYDI